MGLFDHYFPDPPLTCPRCRGSLPSEWQGKDGPSLLYHWQQGKISPIDTDWSEEDMICSKKDYLESARHPDGSFLIYTDCEKCEEFPIHAKITIKDGTWVSTRLLAAEDIDAEFWSLPKERRTQMKHWLTKNL